ncbi:MAG: sulfatase-like hydrolase/transferase [Flavipsychrobacter sp.]|nr:sulfatase-like hydrolase/transferase [Flavipsychrobacter sp.]
MKPGRYSLFLNLLTTYLVSSLIVRIALFTWAFRDIDIQFLALSRALGMGFLYDLASGLGFLLFYQLYLMLLPKRWTGSRFDQSFTYFSAGIMLFIQYFSLLAEFPFWDEFGVRFNFIAVDYLIYTYEVVNNINQSYPIPLILLVLFILTGSSFWYYKRNKALKQTFTSPVSIRRRLQTGVPLLLVSVILLSWLKNKQADFSNNLTINEISKNGVFSFFAAYRSNELDYAQFYRHLPRDKAYQLVRDQIRQDNQVFPSDRTEEIQRITLDSNETKPNIILVTIESFSADFSGLFGNTKGLTPNFDQLAKEGILFTNLYATGTRTVRGMEALTLCVPPTPGNSIVRRPENEGLFSIATILKEKNYHPWFIYGGDGYFDNMNNFFGGQGFDIIDRDRGNPLSDDLESTRYAIPDEEVSFENAWGICDEDIYQEAIRYADSSSLKKQPFFQFIMTTSNHKPYTFPEGKIDLPQGSRDAAVKYTDYALGKFIEAAKSKDWFKNTVFVIVADHCASSAGKWEININKHHIPALIYNLQQPAEQVTRLTSQIDLMPTLFGYLHWKYSTELYGMDVRQRQVEKDRAFVGNYRTLGLIKGNIFTQIDDRKRSKQFQVLEKGNSLKELSSPDSSLISETISYYQTASERFKNGKMKTALR